MQQSGARGWRVVLALLALLPAMLATAEVSSAAAQANDTSYSSPQYGFTISWPATFSIVNEESMDSADRLSLGDSVSYVYFTAGTEFSTAGFAAESFASFIQSDDDYSNVSGVAAPRCVSLSSLPPAAVRCFQVDRRYDDGSVQTEGLLLQAWDLGDGLTLIMVASAELASFDAYLPLFGQIVITPPAPAVSAAPGSPDSIESGDIAFTFDPGVSEADRNDSVEGIRLGQEVIGGFVGTDGLDQVEITVRAEASSRSPYILASTRGRGIEVYAGSPSWREAPPLIRIETLVHELMHVYQNALEASAATLVPLWFDEGTAEALGYLAITRLGVVDQDDIYALNEYLLTRYPVSGSLASLEPYDSMSADSYPLAYIAVQYLLGRGGMSVSALAQVYDAIGTGQSFSNAFVSVFGQSLEEFYVEFDAWRMELVRVTTIPIDFITPPASDSPASAAWVQIQTRIEQGDQLMLVIATQPGASCTVQILIPGSPVERQSSANGEGEAFWLVTVPEAAPTGQVSVRASCGGAAVWQDIVVT